MEARTDFSRYPNAAKMCRNLILFPQGGVTRRPGTRYVKGVKDQTKSTRVLSFQFSQTDAYVIEVGDSYIRPYRRQGSITVDTTDAAITNGSFGAGITGWTDSSTGSAAIAHDATNSRMQLTGADDGVAKATQAITISAAYQASEHVLKFTTAGYGGGTIGLRVGTISGATDILAEVQLTAGYHAIGFTPGTTTFYIQFTNQNSPSRKMYVDDVSFISNAPMEVTWPYVEADLSALRYFQAADVVYLMHSDYAPRRLERRGDRSWSVAEAAFTDGPYLETNNGSDVDSKQLITNALFDNGLNGWTPAGTNSAFVDYNESGQFVELDTGDTVSGGTAGTASIVTTSAVTVTSSATYVCHVLVLAAGPVTVKIGKTSGGTDYVNTTQQPGWSSYNITTSGTSLYVKFEFSTTGVGRAGIGGCQLFGQTARLIKPSATTGTVTLTAYGFQDGAFSAVDVGRLMRMTWPGHEPGYGVITAYSTTTSVSMLVLRELATTTATEDWRLGAWGGDQSYPQVVGFFDGRSVFANTTAKPNSLWFSQSADLQNMRPDSYTNGDTAIEDDDAIAVTLQSTEINPIFWLSGQKQLMIGTAGGQWVITSTGAAITPSDISAKQHAAVPCGDINSIAINQTILFSDRAQRKVHELSYSLQEDSFLATDMTILADHVLRSKVNEMAYQRNPYSIVFCRRADGRLALLSYNKQHEVLGWTQTILGGSFGSGDAVVESICTIPGFDDSGQFLTSGDRNEVWMVVKRTVNGSTVRYIEFMEAFFDGPLREDYDTEVAWQNAMRTSQVDAFFVDCGLTYTGASTTSVSGLDHLEGETVKIISDGKVQADSVVSSGAVSFNDAGTTVHVGLSYKHRYEGLKLAADAASGSGVNKIKLITQVGTILLDTYDFKITTVDYDEEGRTQHTLYDIAMLRDYMDVDAAIPLFTGERNAETDGNFSRDSRIYIESSQPLPFTLLALAPQMEIRAT